MNSEKILIKGAREHNLKNIDIELPRNKLIVFTGISGSGKSSLAFDTIYAEGQRRYVESLSAYARQFLGQMEKPDVDFIEGLSPAISIDQKTVHRNPRSTVGTVTEIYDYLRLLYARIGKPHCYKCGRPISQQTADQIVDQVLALGEGTKVQILAPLVRGRKGEYRELFDELQREGYARVRVNGQIYPLEEAPRLARYKQHEIDALVDRVIVSEKGRNRLADSIETALVRGQGLVRISVVDGQEFLYSEHFSCPDCGLSYEELTPRMFSFNSPYGACPGCDGLGFKLEIDPDLVIDKRKSLSEGGLIPWAKSQSKWLWGILKAVCERDQIDPDAPLGELSDEQRNILLNGVEGQISFPYTNRHGRTRIFQSTFHGLIGNLNRQYRESSSEYIHQEIEGYMSQRACAACNGGRLKPESLSVRVGDLNITELTSLSVRDAFAFMQRLELSEREQLIAHQILKELKARLKFLLDVGLDYLTLDRTAGTLAGGEAQRIRLATQIGSGLVGVLYILDEPSIGLHQRDNRRLLNTLKELRDLGNTVIVVEHDEETIREADFIVDIGPGAGAHGGEVIAIGTLGDVTRCPRSITGQFLSGERVIATPDKRRRGSGKFLEIRGARQHNLKDINVRIPLGLFICITGVSGSGKSTLVDEILYRGLARRLGLATERPGQHNEIVGLENLDKVIEIDQSPIGRTPRSNPATYTGVFDDIRKLFAGVPESRTRGYKPGRFSFNVKGGRCEACQGDGLIKIEMHFLPDVYIPCEICKGQRYNRETLEIKYKEKSIAEVLKMTVEEALGFFENIPPIKRKLQTLFDVGLSYIELGQPATQLSGGEAQRVKLAEELSKRDTGHTLYILDEPTVGLHAADVEKLLDVLNRLVDKGNTVVVIEHLLDFIKVADHVIDLGPEGGDEGGQIVAEGTPEEVAEVPESYTGQFLKRVLAAPTPVRNGSKKRSRALVETVAD